ncbi:MAG: C39 family peptidase [Woeseiaceae bacterium]|nr:C39 family peptidase [Woeseiaceae bacterium]
MNSNIARRFERWSLQLRDLVTGAVLLAAALPVFAGSVWLPDGAGVSNISMRSMQETKFSQVVRQQYDFSCGSAAIATLLTYHYERETTERNAFEAMFEVGDKEKIATAGFSLLDMKGYLESIGYGADGYQASLDTLQEAAIPAIALINVRGYRHFVVVKGVDDNEVLIGDPALGLKYMSRQKFESVWDNGVLFIIKTEPEMGKKNFNQSVEWEQLARAPLGNTMPGESLSGLTVDLPRIGDF